MSLKEYIFKKYGGFADKRYKKLESDKPFKLDDFTSDYDVLDHVCYIFAWVLDEQRIKLVFSNQIPMDVEIASIVDEKNGEISNSNFSIIFNSDEYVFLDRLIIAIQRHRSDSPNYAWVRPRLIESLRKFRSVLKEFHLNM